MTSMIIISEDRGRIASKECYVTFCRLLPSLTRELVTETRVYERIRAVFSLSSRVNGNKDAACVRCARERTMNEACLSFI